MSLQARAPRKHRSTACSAQAAPLPAHRRCRTNRHATGRRRRSACAAAVPNGALAPPPPPQLSADFRYRRVMLKLSGEALEGSHDFGIDPEVLRTVAQEVAVAARSGVQVAIVVGGGNFFRGVNRWEGLERTTADYVGMLATVMNALTLQNALEHEGVEVRVQTAIEMREVAEPFIRRRAIRHLERGRVVLFGAGTGNPFFTTDSAAALRAAEVNAEVYLKATQVDGVYDSDPRENPEARRYTHISYRKCVMDDLRVLDETAFTLCKDNRIPVLVFDLHRPGNILRAIQGRPSLGTVVDAEPDHPDDCMPCRNGVPEQEVNGTADWHPLRHRHNNARQESVVR